MNLIFSTVFPKNHPRAGEPTEFAQKILDGRKLHTVREEYWHWKQYDGEKVNLVERTGKPYRSRIKRFATAKIRVEKITGVSDWSDLCKIIQLDNSKRVLLSFFAQDDGLEVADFVAWFGGYASNLCGQACIWFDDVKGTS